MSEVTNDVVDTLLSAEQKEARVTELIIANKEYFVGTPNTVIDKLNNAITQETTRVEAETERNNAETERKEKEVARNSAEGESGELTLNGVTYTTTGSGREGNEQVRIANEEKRIENESVRMDYINSLINFLNNKSGLTLGIKGVVGTDNKTINLSLNNIKYDESSGWSTVETTQDKNGKNFSFNIENASGQELAQKTEMQTIINNTIKQKIEEITNNNVTTNEITALKNRITALETANKTLTALSKLYAYRIYKTSAGKAYQKFINLSKASYIYGWSNGFSVCKGDSLKITKRGDFVTIAGCVMNSKAISTTTKDVKMFSIHTAFRPVNVSIVSLASVNSKTQATIKIYTNGAVTIKVPAKLAKGAYVRFCITYCTKSA